MCKLSDAIKPPQTLICVLQQLAKVLPTWQITPSADILDKCFKRQDVFELAKRSPISIRRKPRLATAAEMLRITLDIEANLEKFNLPFLILHGENDKVTDPECSREMFKRASSNDKTLKIYPTAWHCLLSGETFEIVEQVKADIKDWIDKHVESIEVTIPN